MSPRTYAVRKRSGGYQVVSFVCQTMRNGATRSHPMYGRAEIDVNNGFFTDHKKAEDLSNELSYDELFRVNWCSDE